MKHYQPSGTRTFYHDVTIELSGHKGCGSNFDVEVEFTATRDTPARLYGEPGDCYPAEAGEREIVTVRAKFGGGKLRSASYHDLPDWLVDYVKDCIDLREIEVDWSEDE